MAILWKFVFQGRPKNRLWNLDIATVLLCGLQVYNFGVLAQVSSTCLSVLGANWDPILIHCWWFGHNVHIYCAFEIPWIL